MDQSPIIFFAEALASETMRIVGLPRPPWKAIRLDRDSLSNDTNFARLASECLQYSGPLFATRYVPNLPEHAFVTETAPVLPTKKRMKHLLLGAYVFDVWAAHRDRRQMLSAITDGGALKLYLYDNSHVFGLSDGPETWHRLLHPRGFPFEVLAQQKGSTHSLVRWSQAMRRACPAVLNRIGNIMPKEWVSPRSLKITEILQQRLDMLDLLVQKDLAEFTMQARVPRILRDISAGLAD